MVRHSIFLFTHSGEGRTPSASDWHAMRVYVAKLKMELDRVQLDFEDENSTDNVTSGGAATAARNHLVNGAGAVATAADAAATATAIGVVVVRAGDEDHHDNGKNDDEVDGSVEQLHSG